MTPEQEELLKRINALPKFDTLLPVTVIENDGTKAAEAQLKEYAASLGKERLSAALSSVITIDGKITTLEEYIREEKRYQLTENANLYSTASARRDEVDELLPELRKTQGLAGQRAAFLAREVSEQNKAPSLFINELRKQPGANELFAAANSETGLRVFDVGYHNGVQSASVVEGLKAVGVAPDKVVWNGMDFLTDVETDGKNARTRLIEAGIKPEHLALAGGKLGFTGTLGDNSPNHALELENTPAEHKDHIVLALNVTNFGDKELFFKQLDGRMKPEAITIALHDTGGDALALRREVNKAAGKELMRNAGDPATMAIEKYFGSEEQKRKPSAFKVPYKVDFSAVTDDMWKIMKENVQTATFNRDYRDDVIGTSTDPEEYKKARLSVEFILGQPLTTYSKDESGQILDAFQKTLAAHDQSLTGTLEGQVILSKEHSLGLAQAVEAAAKATDQQLNPPAQAIAQGVDPVDNQAPSSPEGKLGPNRFIRQDTDSGIPSRGFGR